MILFKIVVTTNPNLQIVLECAYLLYGQQKHY